MDSPDFISVLIVDDHPVVREGLNAMVSAEPDMRVVGEAETGLGAVESYFRLRPAVVLMDLLLPDFSGTEAIRQINAKVSTSPVVVLTSAGGDEEVYRALETGARGYLFKDMVRRELIQAIREVSAGRRYVPPRVGGILALNLPRSGLTARETEVLESVAAGLRNKEIAYKLSISEATVNAHVKRILEKLSASDRTQAVTTALRRGIIRL